MPSCWEQVPIVICAYVTNSCLEYFLELLGEVGTPSSNSIVLLGDFDVLVAIPEPEDRHWRFRSSRLKRPVRLGYLLADIDRMSVTLAEAEAKTQLYEELGEAMEQDFWSLVRFAITVGSIPAGCCYRCCFEQFCS